MARPPRIFHQVAARGAVMTAAPAGVALWAFGPLVAVAVAAAVAGLELRRVRAAVRAGMPTELTFVPSRPTDHTWLDADEFREALTALGEIGFRPVADFTISYPKAPDGFARVLIREDLRVYAEVNQVRHHGQSTPVTMTITSILDDGWSLQTTSEEPLPVIVAFMKARRALWRSLPDRSAAELLTDHMEVRKRMCADLRVGVGGDGTLERYFAAQADGHAARREALLTTSVVAGLARGIGAERRPKKEWLGDYASFRAT
jgi:hypothetical protein